MLRAWYLTVVVFLIRSTADAFTAPAPLHRHSTSTQQASISRIVDRLIPAWRPMGLVNSIRDWLDPKLSPAAIAPLILIGPQGERNELSHLAARLVPPGSMVQPVDLSLAFENGGAEAVAAVLSTLGPLDIAWASGQSLLASKPVETLLAAQPLGIHVAVALNHLRGIDHMRPVCEGMTRFTLTVGDDMASAEEELKFLVTFARKPRRSKKGLSLDMGDNTFFLSLTFPDMSTHKALLQELVHGTDAMELRVDLLADHDPYSVLHQMQLLRHHTRRLPVIYTIRSKGQCGAFDDDPEKLFRLLQWGIRGGAEYLDIEANWPWRYRSAAISLARKRLPAMSLVGSYHVVGRKAKPGEAKKLFKRCYHRGMVDAVKVVTTATEVEDSYKVHEAAASLNLPVPYIGLCLTPTGSLSRVLNKRFTPVTHAKLPSVAAPGQLTSEAIMRLRCELGMVPARRFYLFGSPIAASPSPNMHNAAFMSCQLPHVYGLCEGEGTEQMQAALNDPFFGGGSVTIPHKQNVIPFLNSIESAAKAIGAVNTIVVDTDIQTGKKILRGENTDWLGIMRPIRARLAAAGRTEGGLALVVGAGGAAMGAIYAMQHMGMKVVVYNRTLSKAQELAGKFKAAAVSSLDSSTLKQACGQMAPDVIVSTIPGSAGFTLPEEMLLAQPVVFDAAYKPARTALLDQAVAAGCPYVQGADMLIEQGIEQFQLWTKRRAPRDAMAAAVYATVEKI